MLKHAVDDARLRVSELWMKYFSIGGEAGEYEVDAYLNGSFSLPALQRDILAHAANELIDELPAHPRAPYSDDVAMFLPASRDSDDETDAGNGVKDETGDPPSPFERSRNGEEH